MIAAVIALTADERVAVIAGAAGVVVALITAVPVLMGRRTAKGIQETVGHQNGHGSMMEILAGIYNRVETVAESLMHVKALAESNADKLDVLTGHDQEQDERLDELEGGAGSGVEAP